MADISVRIRGVNTVIRNLAKNKDGVYQGAREGVNDAANYLKMVIQNKLGSYQSTGGAGGGAWAMLKKSTLQHKKTGNTPLLESGALHDSIYVQQGGKGTLSASVASDSPYLVHHIYGAPRAHVPQRDPFKVTASEESDACHEIIMSHTYAAIRRTNI